MAAKKYDWSPVFEVERLLAQIGALIENTYGHSGNAFRGMNKKAQDNYMWAVADLVRELHTTINSHCWVATPIQEAAAPAAE
jgi:hypothetical protein